MRDLQEVKAFYEHHLRKYGKEDIRGMGWHEEDEYSIRFEVMSGVGKLDHSSILDVGCGYGGLHKHLVASRVKGFSYLGVDILPKMVEIAREQNPTGRFEVRDILTEEMGKHDYVFCIGALNVTMEDFEEFFWTMVKRMVELAGKAVALSFLSDRAWLKAGPYHFQNAQELRERLEKECDVRVEILEDPRLKGESCVFVHKK